MSIHSKLFVALMIVSNFCSAAQGPSPLSNSPKLPAANMLPQLLNSRYRQETIPGAVTKQCSQKPKVNSIPEEKQAEQENQPTQ